MARLWSDPDILMLIFAASSMEFAVNPVAEWLFYTGRLPADPVGRFVGTLGYMRELMLAPSDGGFRTACRRIRAIHTAVEAGRGARIPDEAYRDVLLMGMQHSLQALAVSRGHPVSGPEAAEFVRSYRCMARHMNVPDYPVDYSAFRRLRAERLAHYRADACTERLLEAYRRALGPVGYWLLRVLSPAMIEGRIAEILGLRRGRLCRSFETLFPRLRASRIHLLLMPAAARRMHRAGRRMITPAA